MWAVAERIGARSEGVATMKLTRVEIENYRAIQKLDLPLHRGLTVLHGDNGHGKTSVLSAIATGLGSIPMFLPGVSSVDFLPSDRRGSGPWRVRLTTVDGMAWDRPGGLQSVLHLKKAMDAIVDADFKEVEPLALPILAFYDTDRRAVSPQYTRFRTEFSRYGALEGALSARADFRDFFEWFCAKNNEGLMEQEKERPDSSITRNHLEAVHKAIKTMLPAASGHQVFEHSTWSDGEQIESELSINKLSGGYRIMFALAGDLARRMAQGNPHLDDPLQSEAVVLIDEIELHLHPSWQQRVLADLTRTFPNTQFIVSTHSPQVLTTVKPEHIVELGQEQGDIVAGSAAAPTYGAKAGDVLATVMGVEERPPGNEFVKVLAEYRSLVSDDQGESEAARKLRQKLEALSPRDHALNRADMEMRRRKLLQSMDRS